MNQNVWAAVAFTAIVMVAITTIAIFDKPKNQCGEMEIVLKDKTSNTIANFKGHPNAVYGWNSGKCPRVDELIEELKRASPGSVVEKIR